MLNYNAEVPDIFSPSDIKVTRISDKANLQQFKNNVCSTCPRCFLSVILGDQLLCSPPLFDENQITPCRDPQVMEELGIRWQ